MNQLNASGLAPSGAQLIMKIRWWNTLARRALIDLANVQQGEKRSAALKRFDSIEADLRKIQSETDLYLLSE